MRHLLNMSKKLLSLIADYGYKGISFAVTAPNQSPDAIAYRNEVLGELEAALREVYAENEKAIDTLRQKPGTDDSPL